VARETWLDGSRRSLRIGELRCAQAEVAPMPELHRPADPQAGTSRSGVIRRGSCAGGRRGLPHSCHERVVLSE
jgi:hypothetical protein